MSQCAHCECRLDVNRPAHDPGCLGNRLNYGSCEDCGERVLKTELTSDGLCEHCLSETS